MKQLGVVLLFICSIPFWWLCSSIPLVGSRYDTARFSLECPMKRMKESTFCAAEVTGHWSQKLMTPGLARTNHREVSAMKDHLVQDTPLIHQLGVLLILRCTTRRSTGS